MVRKRASSSGLRWVVALLVVALLGAAVYVIAKLPLGPVVSDSNTIKVVAAENFWGNIASQIGGNKVSVTSIISDPNSDPHLYESDAHDAIAIAEANVVIKNGLGYDDFMDKLLSASTSNRRQVLTASNILGISGKNANPHLWYDTPKIPEVASQIESAFAAKDPADKTLFAQNLNNFDTSLGSIQAILADIKAHYCGVPVAYTERVPGYLTEDAGLDVKTPAGFASAIEDGNDPSPADTLAMDDLMTHHEVRVLLYNAQAVSPVTAHVRQLAEAAGIPVIGVTETMPANENTYQSWQLDQVKELQRALGGK
jgi:zinc/manganese transport system substrate-binding protein